MADNAPHNSSWQKLAQEPTLHFFLIAVLIFGLYGLNSLNQENVLELDQREIDARIFLQEMNAGEPLTDDQRDLITARYVEEQILVREALDLGLDNDARIHDMLAQKMLHVLSGDIIQPSEEELQSYYQANIERYTMPEAMDVVELVFDTREPLSDEVVSLLEDGATADSLLALSPGNSDPLPQVTALDLTNIFSEEFATEVFSTGLGSWAGPFISNRGQHWLQINEIIPERIPPLEEIRDRVRLEWINSEEDARLRVEIERLFEKYSIVITDGAEEE